MTRDPLYDAPMTRQRLLAVVVVVVAAFATLGHVCVLSLHEHATQTDADDYEGDRVDAASCEAARTAPAAIERTNAIALATVPVVSQAVRAVEPDRTVARTPIVRGCPPLHLRHTALLI